MAGVIVRLHQGNLAPMTRLASAVSTPSGYPAPVGIDAAVIELPHGFFRFTIHFPRLKCQTHKLSSAPADGS